MTDLETPTIYERIDEWATTPDDEADDDLETFKRCYLTPFAGHIRLWCPDCQPPNNLIGQYPTTIYLTKIARETHHHLATRHGDPDD